MYFDLFNWDTLRFSELFECCRVVPPWCQFADTPPTTSLTQATKRLRAPRSGIQTLSSTATTGLRETGSRLWEFLADLLKGFPHSRVHFLLHLDLSNLFVGERWCLPLSTRSAIPPPAAAPLRHPVTTWHIHHQRDLTPAWGPPTLRYVLSNIFQLLIQKQLYLNEYVCNARENLQDTAKLAFTYWLL